jgi:hypothetical protein
VDRPPPHVADPRPQLPRREQLGPPRRRSARAFPPLCARDLRPSDGDPDGPLPQRLVRAGCSAHLGRSRPLRLGDAGGRWDTIDHRGGLGEVGRPAPGRGEGHPGLRLPRGRTANGGERGRDVVTSLSSKRPVSGGAARPDARGGAPYSRERRSRRPSSDRRNDPRRGRRRHGSVGGRIRLIRKSSRRRTNGTTGLPCVGGESGGGEAIDQAAGSMVTL